MGAKFVESFSMMRGRMFDHVGYFWPGEGDTNGAQCKCGWDGEDDDAQALYDRWGAHVDEVA